MAPRDRLLLPCPAPEGGRAWGDYSFAMSLIAAFARQGRALVPHLWHRSARRRAVGDLARRLIPARAEIVLRGKLPYRPMGRRPLVMWLISQSTTLTDDELSACAHIFVASAAYAEKLRARGYPVSVLPQCTDPALFHPGRAGEVPPQPVLFVGNRRSYAPRPVVEHALATGAPLSVWGRGWDDALPPGLWAGTYIPNDRLGAYYAAAEVVLNDHTADMLSDQFLSNRAYDVLACGRPILTERMAGVPEDLLPFLAFYDGADDFPDALAALRAEGPQEAQRRRDFARHVAERHSFDARAAALIEVLDGL